MVEKSKESAPAKGLTSKIAVITGFFVGAVALLDAATALTTKTQSMTCSLLDTLPWCTQSYGVTLTSADSAVLADLAKLNTDAATLFASLSGNTTPGDFSTYTATYNKLIGGFTNMRMATASREVVTPINAEADLHGICDDIEDCYNLTPSHLDAVIRLLTLMRDTHQRGTLNTELVKGFQGQYQIYVSRIMKFETVLIMHKPAE